MDMRRGLFLMIGVTLLLLIVVSANFLWPAAKPTNRISVSPAVVKTLTATTFAAGAATIRSSDQLSPPQVGSSAAPTYQYNAEGQLQAIIYPDGSTYTYHYNPHGDKIRETSRDGKTWSYVYDQTHHPLAVIDPEGRVTHIETPSTVPRAP